MTSTQRARWRPSRAGILNVYQYEDETLHFAGGRLLLRGVNGSGKSTAMNMAIAFDEHRAVVHEERVMDDVLAAHVADR